MEEVGKILPSLFRRQVRRENAALADLLAPFWARVVGKAIAQHSRPTAFMNGTLTLTTSCSSWAVPLRQMAEEIRAEINSFLGSCVVKRIRVKYVPVDALEETAVAARVPPVETVAAEPSWPEGTGALDPETSKIVERSFAKYFMRPRRLVP